MSAPEVNKPLFFGYPAPKEVVGIELKYPENKNPVLRGVPLVVGAWIISKFEFIQKYLWANAGFGRLRNLVGLSKYSERYYPTVIPVDPRSSGSVSHYYDNLPEHFKTLPNDVPGRYYSIADYHTLYSTKKLTPLDVIESLLPLIRRDVNPPSSHSIAFVDSNVELILKAARESTKRYQEGKDLGLLDGIPVGIKDEVDVADYRTYSGRKEDKMLFDVKTESAWPVQKWQEKGVIIMGKMNMHEIGADTTNNNPNWGTPRNPHNPQFYPGGSSGGPAYAVSTGLLPIALGTDGGGSIRIPSSFCGVYGLKPSHSRIGDVPSTVTVIGPLAASISDLEVAYRVMALPNPTHPISSLFKEPGFQEEYHKSKRPKIIGIFKPWFERAEPEVKKVCYEVIQYLRENLGYQEVPIEIPYMSEGQTAHAITITSEMATRAKTIFPPSQPWLSDMTAPNKVLMPVATQTSATDYILAAQLRHMLMGHLAFLFQKYPGLVIVTPTSTIAGWPIDREGDLKYGVSDVNISLRNMEYVWLANFTGCPAISCPVGYVAPKKGMGDIPIGFMGMGEWGSEDALIELGRDAERWLNEKYPGGRRYPAIWEDLFKRAEGAKKAPE